MRDMSAGLLFSFFLYVHTQQLSWTTQQCQGRGGEERQANISRKVCGWERKMKAEEGGSCIFECVFVLLLFYLSVCILSSA